MQEIDDIATKIRKILDSYPSYKLEAYSFVLDALHDTVGKLPAPRHVSGQEFLNGIREYALDQFGPMARMVLNHWGVHETLDIGKIVFAMVEAGLMRKEARDSLEDFRNYYDFKQAFDQQYTFDA